VELAQVRPLYKKGLGFMTYLFKNKNKKVIKRTTVVRLSEMTWDNPPLASPQIK
tara:strand:- start:1029 stop:1190 length:162 start_codon:yes stop_codon:yes gene_type:complete